MLEGVASQLPEPAVTVCPTARVPAIVGNAVFVGPAASAAFGLTNVAIMVAAEASEIVRIIWRNFITSLSPFRAKI
jgi:hypothetical protein